MKTFKKLLEETMLNEVSENATHKTKDGRTAKKGLWYNINQRKKKGLPPKKPGDKGYPETLDIQEMQTAWSVTKSPHSVTTSKGTFTAFTTSHNPDKYDVRMTKDSNGNKLKAAEGRAKFGRSNIGYEKDVIKFLADLKKQHDGIKESHFDIGDKVECVKSGMEGTIVKKDNPEVGKYYTVKTKTGKLMKYAPEELKEL